MPWIVKKASGSGWNIVREDTGEVVGHSATHEAAVASMRARYANVKEKMAGESEMPHGAKPAGGKKKCSSC